ncbi:MAG: hypothetical protein ACR2HA_07760 [Nocardioides sp.]
MTSDFDSYLDTLRSSRAVRRAVAEHNTIVKTWERLDAVVEVKRWRARRAWTESRAAPSTRHTHGAAKRRWGSAFSGDP